MALNPEDRVAVLCRARRHPKALLNVAESTQAIEELLTRADRRRRAPQPSQG